MVRSSILAEHSRRAAGYQVQYFSAIEEQRRLAPHLHAAVRGAVPRALVRQVVAATDHQVWWPAHDEAKYADSLPAWDDRRGYVDPESGESLPTWEEALELWTPTRTPGRRTWFASGHNSTSMGSSRRRGAADRRVAYLTKYLMKSISDTYGGPLKATPAQRRQVTKLREQIELLPCSPRCWNWLRYGVQPLDAREGIQPGRCPGKLRDPENLGCGGRHVLVSRKWTSKTLDGHRADRAAVVRQVLESAGVEMAEVGRMAAHVRREDGARRFHWTIWDPQEASAPVYRQIMSRVIAERLRWKAQYEGARQRAGPP